MLPYDQGHQQPSKERGASYAKEGRGHQGEFAPTDFMKTAFRCHQPSVHFLATSSQLNIR